MKNTLEGINSRINEEELTVSWKRVVEITAMEQNKGKRMKTVRPLEQHQIHQHLHYGVPEGGERERERERDREALRRFMER